MRMLEKDPGRRYPDGATLAGAVAAVRLGLAGNRGGPVGQGGTGRPTLAGGLPAGSTGPVSVPGQQPVQMSARSPVAGPGAGAPVPAAPAGPPPAVAAPRGGPPVLGSAAAPRATGAPAVVGYPPSPAAGGARIAGRPADPRAGEGRRRHALLIVLLVIIVLVVAAVAVVLVLRSGRSTNADRQSGRPADAVASGAGLPAYAVGWSDRGHRPAVGCGRNAGAADGVDIRPEVCAPSRRALVLTTDLRVRHWSPGGLDVARQHQTVRGLGGSAERRWSV